MENLSDFKAINYTSVYDNDGKFLFREGRSGDKVIIEQKKGKTFWYTVLYPNRPAETYKFA